LPPRLTARRYEGRAWALVEDHINFTLGRLSAHLEDVKRVAYFVHLLGESRQPAQGQATFLRELLFLLKVRASSCSGFRRA
jgi:hypothetical protein